MAIYSSYSPPLAPPLPATSHPFWPLPIVVHLFLLKGSALLLNFCLNICLPSEYFSTEPGQGREEAGGQCLSTRETPVRSDSLLQCANLHVICESQSVFSRLTVVDRRRAEDEVIQEHDHRAKSFKRSPLLIAKLVRSRISQHWQKG